MQNYFSIQLLRVVKSSLWLTSKKIPRTIRLFILFLICSMSFVHATDSFAQKVEISIDAQNQTVEKVLKEIEKQSGFGFFFNNKHVNLKRVVSVSVDKSNIFKVLDKIFEGTDVKYSVLDKKIILSTEMTSKQQQAVKISGKVVDVNGEPVIGASIVEKGTTNGTVTNGTSTRGKYQWNQTCYKGNTRHKNRAEACNSSRDGCLRNPFARILTLNSILNHQYGILS